MRVRWSVTWPEDRATRRRDPSTEPGAKTGGGTRCVPFLLLLRDWPEGDKSRGVWGAEPPSRGLRRWNFGHCSLIVSVLVSRQARVESRSIVCGFARSRSFRPECQPCNSAERFSDPAAPQTHPFVNSAAAVHNRRAVLKESRHRSFLVRPSRRPGPSQSVQRRETQ